MLSYLEINHAHPDVFTSTCRRVCECVFLCLLCVCIGVGTSLKYLNSGNSFPLTGKKDVMVIDSGSEHTQEQDRSLN